MPQQTATLQSAGQVVHSPPATLQVPLRHSAGAAQSAGQLPFVSPTATSHNPFPQQAATLQSAGQVVHSPPATLQVPLGHSAGGGGGGGGGAPQSAGQFSEVSPESQFPSPQTGQLIVLQFWKGLPAGVKKVITVSTINQARKIIASPITVAVKIFFAPPILPGSPPAVRNIAPPTTIIKTAKGKIIFKVKKSTILLNKTKR